MLPKKFDCVVTHTDYLNRRPVVRSLWLDILPAHPASRGWLQLVVPNYTRVILHPRAALALEEGRIITVRVDRLYQCQRVEFVRQPGTEEVLAAAEAEVAAEEAVLATD